MMILETVSFVLIEQEGSMLVRWLMKIGQGSCINTLHDTKNAVAVFKAKPVKTIRPTCIEATWHSFRWNQFCSSWSPDRLPQQRSEAFQFGLDRPFGREDRRDFSLWNVIKFQLSEIGDKGFGLILLCNYGKQDRCWNWNANGASRSVSSSPSHHRHDRHFLRHHQHLWSSSSSSSFKPSS